MASRGAGAGPSFALSAEAGFGVHLLVGEGVVAGALGFEVVEGGGSAVLPGDDVVDVALVGGDVAALLGAGLVADDDGAALGGADDAGAAAEVEDL